MRRARRSRRARSTSSTAAPAPGALMTRPRRANPPGLVGPGSMPGPRRPALRTAVVIGLVVAVVIASAVIAEVRPQALLDPRAHADIGRFVRGLFQPDLSRDFLGTVALAALRTLAIAVAGTALSV